MSVLRKIGGLIKVVGMLLMCGSIGHADIDMYPRVPRCVKIDNVDEWPGYYLIGYESWLQTKVGAYIVEQDVCLEKKVYKFNTFTIYAMEKAYVDSMGLDNLDPETDLNAMPANVNIELNGKLVNEDNLLLSEEITYSIIDITDNMNK